MFERGPFKDCPKCTEKGTFGILMAGWDTLRRRCTKCHYSAAEILPPLEKKVIYLDQLAVSELFKIRAGTRKPGAPHETFWKEADNLINGTLLLQQAIFPHSDIHLNETIVAPLATELQRAYEHLGGDASFVESYTVELSQVWEFANAFLNGRPPPTLDFNVDDILHHSRNVWLSDMHITVNADFAQFADDIRHAREAQASGMAGRAARWSAEKPSFDQVLEAELKGYGAARRSVWMQVMMKYLQSITSGDPKGIVESASHSVNIEFTQLREKFQRAGVPASRVNDEIFRYWDWAGNEQLPFQRIAAYMFASLARKMGQGGQKRPPTRGMMNDIRAISIYAPYVDAMFLDNECAGMLSEEPLRSDLHFKAKIFCLNRADEFLGYLRQLEGQTPAPVRKFANQVYGVA